MLGQYLFGRWLFRRPLWVQGLIFGSWGVLGVLGTIRGKLWAWVPVFALMGLVPYLRLAWLKTRQ